METDIAVIGAGIVGLATAYALRKKYPHKKILVLEKESMVAAHQSGHNSGVLHSGVYYKPGSLKAINCTRGKTLMEQFCKEEGLNYEICGKIIVATSEPELTALERLHERAVANLVECEVLAPERMREIEPYVNGIKALRIPTAGIVDYVQVCERLKNKIENGTANNSDMSTNGSSVVKDCKLIAARRYPKHIILETEQGTIESSLVVNCAGLHSDRVAKILGLEPSVKIIPFRGEYYKLLDSAKGLCKHLIYPVPDARFPFLGVHFTRMISGEVECGPNAVLAFAREGYTKSKINFFDLLDSLTYPGFLKMSQKFWREGMYEMQRSFSKAAFVKALQKLVPDIKAEYLVTAQAGVRAQAVTPSGALVDDFVIEERERVVHVLNAPSPAATSSLNIGESIAGILAKQIS